MAFLLAKNYKANPLGVGFMRKGEKRLFTCHSMNAQGMPTAISTWK
jgi:hypothetical protein